jgi:PAS domain-containing protein
MARNLRRGDPYVSPQRLSEQTGALSRVNALGTVLAGGGEMGALMRAFDWSQTAVGPVENWPQSLRTALSILLDSRFPMYISWGPEYVQFYNDGYRPVLGTKHPDALGRSTYDTWSEVWNDIVGPLFWKVKAEGEATYLEDFLFPLYRYGYTEECYFTFCYSRIREESGGAGGVLVTCIETTARVVGERRLRTLRELASRAAESRSAEDACRGATAVLAANPHDLPFASIYLVENEHIARLAGSCGLTPGHPATPGALSLAGEGAVWPAAEVVSTGKAQLVDDLGARFSALPGGPWPEPPHSAVVVPVPRAGDDRVAAILIAGISPRRAFDDDYRGFVDLIAGHLSRAIASAQAYQVERNARRRSPSSIGRKPFSFRT